MDYLNEGHEKFCRWRDEVVPKQDAEIARLTKRVGELETLVDQLRELVETAFSEGYYAASTWEDPYQDSYPHWQESSSRKALEGSCE